MSETIGGIDYSKIKEKLREAIPCRKALSFNLGYVVGVLVGDGKLYRVGSHYTIELETTNKEFLGRFQESVERLLGKKPGYKTDYDRKPSGFRTKKTHYYKVRFYCKEWYGKLKSLVDMVRNGVIPFHDNESFVKGFLRGFYDSEGYVSHYKHGKGKKHNKPWDAWELCMRNTNLKLLQAIDGLLRKYGINPTNIYLHERSRGNHKDVYSLAFFRRAEIEKLGHFISEVKSDG